MTNTSVAERIEELANRLSGGPGDGNSIDRENAVIARAIATDLRAQVGDVVAQCALLRNFVRILNADGFVIYRERVKQAANTIEAQARRIAELEREQAYADHCFKQMEERADALVAENAALRKSLELRATVYGMKDKKCAVCGERSAPYEEIKHLPSCALSTPNERAARLLVVVEAAKVWKAEYEKPDEQPANAVHARINLFAALTALDGDKP